MEELSEQGHEGIPRFGSIVPEIDGMLGAFDERLPLEMRLVMQTMSEHAIHCENERLQYYPDTSDVEGDMDNGANPAQWDRAEVTAFQDFSRKHITHDSYLRSAAMRITSEFEMDEDIASIRRMVAENEDRITGSDNEKRLGHTRSQNGKQNSKKYSDEDIPRLKDRWYREYGDIMDGVPPELPPLRAVNHEINLIDENRRYMYHRPSCPESLRLELRDKTERYVRSGWWIPTAAMMAAPVLCLRKKDGHLRTVMDLRQRNDNTVKDVTPMPDQDTIRDDVARAKYRSKIDLSDAYEQVLIILRDRHKTAFRTVRMAFLD